MPLQKFWQKSLLQSREDLEVSYFLVNIPFEIQKLGIQRQWGVSIIVRYSEFYDQSLDTPSASRFPCLAIAAQVSVPYLQLFDHNIILVYRMVAFLISIWTYYRKSNDKYNSNNFGLIWPFYWTDQKVCISHIFHHKSVDYTNDTHNNNYPGQLDYRTPKILILFTIVVSQQPKIKFSVMFRKKEKLSKFKALV